MLSPMQRHLKAAREKQALEEKREQLDQGKAEAPEPSQDNYAEFEVTKASAEQDHEALRNTARDERDAKRGELVKRYQGFVESYLEQAEVYANPVLVYVMLWLFDLKKIGEALKLAFVAIEQKQEMVAPFKRNVATFVVDFIADWAKGELKEGHAVEPYLSQVLEKIESWPVEDVVAMKFYKLAGEAAYHGERYQEAVQHLKTAQSLETAKHKAKVKTILDKALQKLES